MKFLTTCAGLAVSLASGAYGIELDLTSESSVNNALSSIAYDMMTYYNGNETGKTPGLLPGPCQSIECYYWWQVGGMWGALINYYQYTGDATYQDNVLQALAFQIGPDQNYNPPNQSKNMGIDDQAFWAFAALEAAEAGIPDAQDANTPSWINLAENVFNFQAALWDTETCNGGLRWQVYSFNAGYNLKNTISTGSFFNLAARLARYTGNSTYAEWAVKAYDWLEQSPLLQTKDSVLYVWDNTDTDTNCTDVQNFIWTYDYGVLLLGSAMMYNHTNGGAEWQTRINAILDSALTLFFDDTQGYMSEILCEEIGTCNNDQSSMKSYLSRWLGVTSVLAPFTSARITPALTKSAQGAAAQCVGGDNGRQCGRQWYSTTWDGSDGVGQQMSALAVIGATRMTASLAPLRASENQSSSNSSKSGATGGNSGTNGNGSGAGGAGGTNGVSRVTGTTGLLVTLSAFVIGMCISL